MFTSRSKSTNEEQVTDSTSMIGAGTNITGHLDTNGDIRIDGTLKGNIYGKAKVLIGPMGVVEGDIHCREANIMGQVTGCIKVMELLHLKGKAAVAGDIHTSKLLIEPTVNFNGQCHMGANIVELNADMHLAVNE